MSLMWIFYSSVGDDAKGFYSKSAMIMNVLGLAYGAGVWVTISLCKYLTLYQKKVEFILFGSDY